MSEASYGPGDLEPPDRARMESAIERLLADEAMARRVFLGRGAGALAMAAGLSSFLAACGIKGTAEAQLDQLAKAAAGVK